MARKPMKPDCQIIQGDCRTVLAELQEKSVHCVVTSPPYHGLRKYEGVEPSVWGDSSHRRAMSPRDHAHEWQDNGRCKGCRCWRGLLGLEPSIEQYCRNIVECFRAVKRVLRDDGTLWLNLGDSYAGGGRGGDSGMSTLQGVACDESVAAKVPSKLRAKNLIGQPWRVAFALQADGWILRSDIIWHKPNPMPESVTDRPTRAHEYLFLLTKKPKYYYDAEAIREKATVGRTDNSENIYRSVGDADNAAEHFSRRVMSNDPSTGRNKRSVWTIPTQANPEAHFASFPRKLALPCVLAGTSEKGCCPECGTPWIRVVDKDRQPTRPARDNKQDATGMANRDHGRHVTDVKTLGWEPGCECFDPTQVCPLGGNPDDYKFIRDPIPCTVLDPFVGSGTAGIVATQQGRNFIGIDASAEYCEMSRRRIANPEPEPELPDVDGQMMFEELEPEAEAAASRENGLLGTLQAEGPGAKVDSRRANADQPK